MSKHIPRTWSIVNIKKGKDIVNKILASWSGGYLDGDSWRISSNIVKIEEKDDLYLFHNHSGSVYTCYKNREGFSYMIESIYNGIKKTVKSDKDASAEIMKAEVFVENFKK